MHIIVTTISITIKFCTVIKTTKHSFSWVVQNVRNKSKMGDELSYFGNCTTDHREIWHDLRIFPSRNFTVPAFLRLPKTTIITLSL